VLVLHALLALAARPPEAGAQEVGAWTLRERVEVARSDGWSEGELRALADDVLAAARETSSRGTFLSVLGLAAELCREASSADARGLREASLELLAAHESDTMRWSTLVLESFVPNFAALPRDAWAEELEAYDRLLERLATPDASDRVRGELASAGVFARVVIDRHWDWLDAESRRAALEDLSELRRRFGDRARPGTEDGGDDTIARRAERYEIALTRLAFGAAAPPTHGVDLEGERVDVAELRGKLVVLDFWTSFCQPCLELVPHNKDLLRELDGEPLVLLGVCGDTDREIGRATAARVGMTWPSLWDGPRGTDGPAATAWQVNAVGWPTVIVLDGRGRIRVKLYGKDDVEQRLEGELRRLLAEASEGTERR